MKKLTLDLDELNVDSFTTLERTRVKGTVLAFTEGWSDASVCPTTTPTDCKVCRPFPR
ncbi:MAG TPA: hypothetical protein VFJ16_29030 [Longimicrobium sp.]|nr:hypothetical protein [Longimicrobium sp.]